MARMIASPSGLRRQILHEGAVDLDLVERERAQVAQRRVAGAEIVHGDAHAEFPQPMQGLQRLGVLLQQHALGDLHLQPLGRQARSRQRRDDRLDQPVALELRGRDVHRDRHVGAGQVMASRQACRMTHSPIGTIRPISSASGMKSSGRHQPALGMLPADQGLAADQPCRSRVAAVAGSAAGTRAAPGPGACRVRAGGAPACARPSRVRRSGRCRARRAWPGRARGRRSSGACRPSVPSSGRERDADAGADGQEVTLDHVGPADQVDDRGGPAPACPPRRARPPAGSRTRRRRSAPPYRSAGPSSAGGRRPSPAGRRRSDGRACR